MKKLLIATVIGSAFIISCGGGGNKKAEEQKEEVAAPAPVVSKNSNEFNQSFEKLLGNYFELKDALVATDSAKANAAAKKLAVDADSLNVKALTDSTGALQSTAQSYTGTISGSAKGLVGEKDIEAKRKEFQMISDAMYDLVRTVRYDKQKIYHQFCPMAFNNAGAAWLSQLEEIKNPYFGSKMLNCGETQDVLDFGAAGEPAKASE
ncbi:DUF3347 domain-containing protein [Pinibacter aurantiacus]|uniref:DUF3347 domain-containing protein n=1 Tax=Pinibacter aurantiacus TaxID=2851599 RepID=A0A9E2S567_9BACT|nr:DUF3347 domain-containing protein [Pinibacter aurantiacus]MBV4356136.1 DUF3347 domain-containing protein [Pinibacter aurantiacus]